MSFPVSARTSHVLPWSMWPAVPTVSGMRRRRRRPRRARRRRGCGSRAGAFRRGRSRPRRLAGAERRGELLLERAGEARQLGEGERAAAHTGDGLLDRPAGQLGEALGAGANSGGRLADHPQHRDVAVERQRPLERRERELVGPESPLERVAAESLDELGATDDDAGLRAAEQLVAREAHEIGAGGE